MQWPLRITFPRRKAASTFSAAYCIDVEIPANFYVTLPLVIRIGQGPNEDELLAARRFYSPVTFTAFLGVTYGP
jgi:hypothetical protein